MAQQKHSPQPACRDFEETLVLYYYGDCEGPERDRAEEHLKACSSCSHFLAELGTFLPLMAKPKEFPQSFWDNYYGELRRKLAAGDPRESWWGGRFSWLRPLAVPALGAAMIVILALALPFTATIWRPQGQPGEEAAPQEIRTVAKNLDFFESMDLLESLDLLEALEEAKARNGHGQKL
ncbi:MAG: zf-HC2 domain-containing protein [Deltaproteobacteria bacterium]|nr:zf-HC2 domain-containing protein [Deltaproteobacteria bacterium]MBI2539165.1 zf-HC2 domain-containing protein [Deltaproteobacteria bacterium]MBI3063050.1 zf-HC2 domain-containing protein [Deltaproteobacteria bacterium]